MLKANGRINMAIVRAQNTKNHVIVKAMNPDALIILKSGMKKMNTFNMMIKAKETGNTYRADDMLYSSHLGFHDKLGKKWYGDAFEYLNDLFAIDKWQEDNNIYMTKSEAEKKYNIKIVGD